MNKPVDFAILASDMLESRTARVDLERRWSSLFSTEGFGEAIKNALAWMSDFMKNVINNRDRFYKFVPTFKAENFDFTAKPLSALLKLDDIKKRIICVEQMIGLEHHFRFEAHEIKMITSDVESIKSLQEQIKSTKVPVEVESVTAAGWTQYTTPDILRKCVALYQALDHIKGSMSSVEEVMNLKARIVAGATRDNQDVADREKVAEQCRVLVLTFYKSIIAETDAVCMAVLSNILKFPKASVEQ